MKTNQILHIILAIAVLVHSASSLGFMSNASESTSMSEHMISVGPGTSDEPESPCQKEVTDLSESPAECCESTDNF